MKESLPFFVVLAVVTVAIIGIVSFSGWVITPSYTLEIILFLAFFTFVIYVYLLEWNHRSPQMFTQFYLLSIALKLLAYGVIVWFIIAFDKDGAIGNTVLFLICYIVFTLLEVVFLFRKINRS